MSHQSFRDRRDAGRQLAAAVSFLKKRNPVVLALPRGGVPVAYEVALALEVPLDVLLVRKLGSPMSKELGLGALVEGDPPQQVLNESVVSLVHPSAEYLEQESARQLEEMRRRRQAYCGNRPRADVRGRTVIVIDDGIATGSTMQAALKGLRDAGAASLIFAVPVAPRDTLEHLCGLADDGICLLTPEHFRAVSMYYDNFVQTEDKEVTDLLDAAAFAHSRVSAPKGTSMQTVSDIMTHDLTVVGPHDNVQRASNIMSGWNSGVLPVCDDQRLVGTITDRDITLHIKDSGRPAEEIRVSDVMTDDFVWCFEDQSVSEVQQQMRDSDVRRIPVLDRSMQLVGMVTIDDDAGAQSSAEADHGEKEIRLRRPQSDQADGRF